MATDVRDRLAERAVVRLEPDLTVLSTSDRAMLPHLVEAARVMDELYWRTTAGGIREEMLGSIEDPATQQLVEHNVGPWDRLHERAPLLPGTPPRPPGALFYPADMTREEFEAAAAQPGGDALRSRYTVVRRDGTGKLVAVPYGVAYKAQLARAAGALRTAAALSEDAGLRRYLELRATALETDDYLDSDRAWLDMKSNHLEVIVGPIETYEDLLFGYKASYEAFVLIKDRTWSERLARYAARLPDVQAGLPVPEAYRRERPGVDGDLQVYDTVFMAGDAQGLVPVGINLPDDARVRAEKGTRRLQLRSLMRSKFEAISERIADVLIAADQRANVTFEAMFQGIMFHEVAHGLGVSRTVDGSMTVPQALTSNHAAIEEQKSDVLGQHILDRLDDDGEVGLAPRLDRYVSFVVETFRRVRFGGMNAYTASSASQLNRFVEDGALLRDPATGRYAIDPVKFRTSIECLAGDLLRIQGDGDAVRARDWVAASRLDGDLLADVARINAAGVPVNVYFENPAGL